MTKSVVSVDNEDVENLPAMRQAYLLLCSTAADVLSKPEFFGKVTIDLFIQNGRFTGLEKNVKQTVKLN